MKEQKDTHLATARSNKNGQIRITIPQPTSIVGGDHVIVSRIDPNNLDLLKQKHIAINVQFKNKERVNFSNIKRQVKKE